MCIRFCLDLLFCKCCRNCDDRKNADETIVVGAISNPLDSLDTQTEIGPDETMVSESGVERLPTPSTPQNSVVPGRRDVADSNTYTTPNIGRGNANQGFVSSEYIDVNDIPKATGIYGAICEYEARETNQLSFKRGDKFHVKKMGADGWWRLKSLSTGEEGEGPWSYIMPFNNQVFPWFMGKISPAQVNSFFEKETTNGTFMVRESERNPDTFILCVLFNDPSNRRMVKNYNIRSDADTKGCYISERSRFNDIVELIDHHKRVADDLCCKLQPACEMRETAETSSFGAMSTIEWSSLEFAEEIGSGNCGVVYRGKLNNMMDVAIKQINPEKMSPEEVLMEAGILKQLKHVNILEIYAIVRQPVCIVTEYMPNGSLLYCLKTGKFNNPGTADHVDLAAQITAGMAYMEQKKYVHRDLRAKNVLVGQRGMCKVADFGLARLIKDDEYKVSGNSMFPAKWTAPEGLGEKIFTTKSDVWSFGVLLTEIVTSGAEPYGDMNNWDVASQVMNGYRMPQPPCCANEFYQIMLDCWNENPYDRPTFQYLMSVFAVWSEKGRVVLQ